jgi:hypothetical protein
MRLLVIIVGLMMLSLSLLSCVTTAEEMATKDDTHCRSMGVEPGAPAYVECRLAQDNIHQRDRAAIGASPAAAMLQGMKGN